MSDTQNTYIHMRLDEQGLDDSKPMGRAIMASSRGDRINHDTKG